jgi:hypothetical protein
MGQKTSNFVQVIKFAVLTKVVAFWKVKAVFYYTKTALKIIISMLNQENKNLLHLL